MGVHELEQAGRRVERILEVLANVGRKYPRETVPADMRDWILVGDALRRGDRAYFSPWTSEDGRSGLIVTTLGRTSVVLQPELLGMREDQVASHARQRYWSHKDWSKARLKGVQRKGVQDLRDKRDRAARELGSIERRLEEAEAGYRSQHGSDA